MSEAEIHKEIVDWMLLVLPDGSVFHHSPNEGRHKVQYRMLQKRLGVKAGWPDLEVFIPPAVWHDPTSWKPVFLEVKTEKGRVSEKQKEVHIALEKIGCIVAVVRSAEDVDEFLEKLVRLRRVA